ncbi:MAG: GTP-binding protein, partial [Micromonosporaceae bacterium]
MSAAPLLFRSPAAAPGARDASGAAARRQVVLLSGFLGSGKTTLLRTELARSKSDPPAVIVNDVGDTVVDHALLT